jgi:hypothetical protein
MRLGTLALGSGHQPRNRKRIWILLAAKRVPFT